MKINSKRLIIFTFAIALVFSVFIFSFIQADIANVNPNTGEANVLGLNPDNLPQSPEELKETSADFLKKEWGKILAKNLYVGPIIKSYQKISPYTDPIFKYTIGMTPSLTWLFFLTLVLWIFFVIYMLKILDLVSIFSRSVQYIVSFGLIIIFSLIGVTRKIAEYIINAISLLTSWWMQLIVASIVILGLILASIFSENIKKLVENIKKNRAKMEEEVGRERLKKITKSLSVLAKD